MKRQADINILEKKYTFTPQDYINEAYNYFILGNYNNALLSCEQGLKSIKPTDDRVFLENEFIAWQIKILNALAYTAPNVETSVKFYNKLLKIKISDDNLDESLVRKKFHELLGEFKDLSARYPNGNYAFNGLTTKVVENYSNAYLNLYEAHYKKNKVRNMQYLQNSLSINISNAASYNAYGKFLFEEKKYDKARCNYIIAINWAKDFETFSNAKFNLGKMFYNLKNYTAAASLLIECLIADTKFRYYDDVNFLNMLIESLDKTPYSIDKYMLEINDHRLKLLTKIKLKDTYDTTLNIRDLFIPGKDVKEFWNVKNGIRVEGKAITLLNIISQLPESNNMKAIAHNCLINSLNESIRVYKKISTMIVRDPYEKVTEYCANRLNDIHTKEHMRGALFFLIQFLYTKDHIEELARKSIYPTRSIIPGSLVEMCAVTILSTECKNLPDFQLPLIEDAKNAYGFIFNKIHTLASSLKEASIAK